MLRVRRPFYFINSQMNIEDAAGEKLGEVGQLQGPACTFASCQPPPPTHLRLPQAHATPFRLQIVQRWHLWRRNYDLYLGRRQFASINGSFLAWEFELKDEAGGRCLHSSFAVVPVPIMPRVMVTYCTPRSFVCPSCGGGGDQKGQAKYRIRG